MMNATRWWEEVVSVAARAFAEAVERGDFELANKWADVLLRTVDREDAA